MTVTEFVLWGTKDGDQWWEEQVITETTDKNHLKKAKEWATSNGFHSLRVLKTFNGDKPNFQNTVMGEK